jgi:hypothetical protein
MTRVARRLVSMVCLRVLWAGTSRKDGVMRTLRRVVLVFAVALVGACAESALSPPSALATFDDQGNFVTYVYNLTPYTWTLVAANAQNPNGDVSPCFDCWITSPSATIAPGGAMGYQIKPFDNETGGICFGSYKWGYNAYFTYRIDVLGGPPEYQTVAISGQESTGCFGDHDPLIQAWNTSAPPPPGYAQVGIGQGYPVPAALTSNPQLVKVSTRKTLI